MHTYKNKKYIQSRAYRAGLLGFQNRASKQDAIDNKKSDDEWGSEMVPVPVEVASKEKSYWMDTAFY